ncbi:MAG: hypothetical protein HY252_04405 [Sphingobacteriales bacterium]|nr:hypothetical protein [Sphingobacteriales bacterium]
MIVTIIVIALLLLSFSSFAFRMLTPATTGDSILPKLKFISVRPAAGKNIIAWEADQDLPTVYYEVQRSADSIDFKTIATVLGPKPTTNQHYYFEFGDNPLKQRKKMYYRIKQINAAGEVYYTGIIRSVNPD